MQQTLTRTRAPRQGRFAMLMELYESNYMLLRKLAPSLRDMDQSRYLSFRAGAVPLELSSIVHSRYTSSFQLTYRFSARQKSAREPDLVIRLYHDARTAEVISGLMPRSRSEVRRHRELDEGIRFNRFLNKWLAYCLRQGHRFEIDGAVAIIE